MCQVLGSFKSEFRPFFSSYNVRHSAGLFLLRLLWSSFGMSLGLKEQMMMKMRLMGKELMGLEIELMRMEKMVRGQMVMKQMWMELM